MRRAQQGVVLFVSLIILSSSVRPVTAETVRGAPAAKASGQEAERYECDDESA